MLLEEADELTGGVRPKRVGVGAMATSSGPGVAGLVDGPLLDEASVAVPMDHACVGTATGAELLVGGGDCRCPPSRTDHGVEGVVDKRVGVDMVDDAIAITVEHDERYSPLWR